MPVALDGTVIAVAKAATVLGALTTTSTNDVIIVFTSVLGGAATVSAVVGTGLSFTQRSLPAGTIASSIIVQEWYAIASSVFSNTITATVSASTNVAILAFGVSGVNTTTPFDTNAALPNVATVTAATITGTVSTTFPNDFVFSVVAHVSTEATSTIPAGFTLIEAGTGTMGPSAAYEVPSTTLTTSTAQWKFPTSRAMIDVSDALQPLNQPKAGAGTFAGTHALVSSQHETGAGQFAGTHALVVSGKAAGEGLLHASGSVLPFGVDGSVHFATTSVTTCSATLTTTFSNDVIIAVLGYNNAHLPGTVSGGGLTWNPRTRTTYSGTYTVEEWYAIAASPLSSAVITGSISVGTIGIELAVFGISGANTTSPFDSNLSLPIGATGSSVTTLGATITTTNANDFIFTAILSGSVTGQTWTPPSGMTNITTSGHAPSLATAGGGVSVVQANVVESWVFGTVAAKSEMFVDAVISASSPISGNASGVGTFSDTNVSIQAVGSGKATGAGTLHGAGTVLATSPSVAAGEGQFAGTHALVVSEKGTGAGTFAGTHTLKTSQAETGEGQFAGTHALKTSQVEAGEGRFAGAHTLVSSQKETGTGTFAGTHSLVSSQKETGEGQFAGTHTIKTSQAEAGEGRFAGTHTTIVSGKATGTGSQRATGVAVGTSPGSVAGEGRFAGTHSLVVSGKHTGTGGFSDSVAIKTNANVAGSGGLGSSFALKVSGKVAGEGTFSGSGKASLPPASTTGRGGFKTTVTAFACAGSSNVPYAARQETGGVTAPTLEVAPGVYAFNVDVLTNPITGGLPPPDGGTVNVS